MKTKIQNIFIYNLSFFSILYIFLFIFYPENSSYFECNEVSKINNLGVVFNIPVSCDLDLYLVGIKDFSTIYTFDYNYQTRPIFILYISIFYNFFSLFISNLDVLGLVAFGIGHIVIATFSIKIFLKTLDITTIKSIFICTIIFQNQLKPPRIRCILRLISV